MSFLSHHHIWSLVFIFFYHVMKFVWWNDLNWSLWGSYSLDHTAALQHRECIFLSQYPFLQHTDHFIACNHREIFSDVPTVWWEVLLPVLSTFLLLLLTNPNTTEFTASANEASSCDKTRRNSTGTCNTVLPCVLYTIMTSTDTLLPADQLRHLCMLLVLWLSLHLDEECSRRGILEMLGCRDVLMVTCFGVICFFHTEYFLVFPAIFYLAITEGNTSNSNDSIGKKDGEDRDFSVKTSLGIQLLIIVSIWTFVYYSYQDVVHHILASWSTSVPFLRNIATVVTQHAQLCASHFDLSRPHYNVSYGILWYLHALSLPEFAGYFQGLLMLQPLLASCTALALLRRKRVSDRVLVALILLITQLFVLHPRLSDCALLLAVLWAEAEEVISDMRYLPIIAVGVIVPLCLSPVMFNLWAIKGSGNANFLFFQGLALWVFLALFVIEFSNTVIRAKQKLIEERVKTLET